MTDTITERTVVPLNPAATQATREGVAAENDHDRPPMPDQRVGPQAEGPEQPDSQPRPAQEQIGLKDIQVGNKDGRGFKITRIYAVQSDEYAIYQAGEVMVHCRRPRESAGPEESYACGEFTRRKSTRLSMDCRAAKSAIGNSPTLYS
jgi:hypothetical protein